MAAPTRRVPASAGRCTDDAWPTTASVSSRTARGVGVRSNPCGSKHFTTAAAGRHATLLATAELMEYRHMLEVYRNSVAGQLGAALEMLGQCIDACPDAQWDTPVAKYPFWQVAYHTLCFVDVYLARDNDAWTPRTGPGGLHPRGRAELDEEYPSRRFTREELRAYVALCRAQLRAALYAETAASLVGPSGFAHLPFTRAELHLYNVRHAQHHAGQLSAFLHRLGGAVPWTKTARRS